MPQLSTKLDPNKRNKQKKRKKRTPPGLCQHASKYITPFLRYQHETRSGFRSRVAVYFNMLDPSPNTKYRHNGAVLIKCKAIHNIVTSAAEAETHGVYYNIRVSIPIRNLSIAMGNPELPVPIQT